MVTPNMWTRQRLLPIDLLLSALLFSRTSTAELFYTACSPVVQDGFFNVAPTSCPRAQDGYTSNTFPWTHNPTCVEAVLPDADGVGPDIHQRFCAYTNSNYNNGRGISFIVSPEVAASINSETFGMGVGGLDGQMGEEMGMWEVKKTERKGQGLFAKKDIAAIFAGESVIVKTPVLLVQKDLFNDKLAMRPQFLLNKAVEQLPKKTKETFLKLDASHGGSVKDLVSTNGITVKWPWDDDVPELLVVTPEVAVSYFYSRNGSLILQSGN